MYNILKQSKISFINELTHKNTGFEWVGKYRYDFYFEKDGKSYIVEMDGGFHFGDYFRTHEESSVVDAEKDRLAKEHGVQIIRINCNYNDVSRRFDFVKNSILKSRLSQILNLCSINWEDANRSATSSSIKAVATMWDSGMHDKRQIATNIGCSVDAVEKYLKISESLGLSTYNKEQDKRAGINRTVRSLSKPLILLKNDEIINVFASTMDLDRRSVDLYGVHLFAQHIGAVCRGDRLNTNGYTMKYITNEEYEQLLPQFQTIQN
jgi:very-short-patch-repair endonuclease